MKTIRFLPCVLFTICVLICFLPLREISSDMTYVSTLRKVKMYSYVGLYPLPTRIYPLYLIYFLGKFFRLLSVYIVYQYFSLPSSSVVIFSLICLSLASTVFLIVHRPWRGRPLTSYQLVPTVINGALMSLSLVLWGEGLRICGPVRTVMAEYVGAVIGAISTLILGRGGRKWKKVAGLVAMFASYFFLSQGWAISTYSPFSYRSQTSAKMHYRETENVGFSSMSLVFLAGVLAGLNRVIARRVSLKMQMRKRLHVVSSVAASCFLFPLAMFQATLKNSSGFVGEITFPFQSIVVFTVFGMIVNFYSDLMADERLHVSIASAKHLMVTTGCLAVLELIYAMNFSPLGFLICASLLGLGIFESTSTDKIQRVHEQLPTGAQLSDGIAESTNSLIMTPVLGSLSGI